MASSFESSFREELAILRELGPQMARAHPGLCDALAHAGTDPDVERLLEGFALVAARVRERTGDAIPEAVEALAEAVAPHALWPVPASTVMELAPRPGLAHERVRIAKDAAFGARAIDGVKCELRSTTEMELTPIVIERSVLDRSASRAPKLVVRLRAPRSALGALHAARPLRFFVLAPLADASALALALDRHLAGVRARPVGSERDLAVEARLVDPEREPHLPWPERSPTGARVLTETAYFPERHLFFDVTGLERVPDAERREQLELELRFAPEAALVLPERLPEDALRLHCVPAIDVFTCDAEPIRWEDDLRDAPLRAAGLPPHAIEVLDVTRVTGIAPGARARRAYHPYASLEAGADVGQFALRRTLSPLDGRVDTFLRVTGRATLEPETLSIELRCTHRALASRLRPGDVSEPIHGSPSLATFTNLLPVGPSSPPKLASAALASLVGATAVGHRARLDASALRAWWLSCAVPSGVDVGRSRGAAALAAALVAVHASPIRAARRGVIERGVDVALELDAARVPSVGEAFLFARALDRALASELPLQARQRVSVRHVPSGAAYAFPARGGLEELG
ncbi:MAG: type VI secretion system baseplate subunit TssF [Sandaracinus sp.]